MKSSLSALLLVFLLGNLFQACQSMENPAPGPYQQIQDEKVREILQKAIARAGGLENWRNLQSLQFQKYTVLYEASGAVESEGWQANDYRFRPSEQFKVSWNANEQSHELIYQNGRVERKTGGIPDTGADQQALLNSILSATFVISIPFKLLDPGVELTYAGRDTLEDQQVVEVIKATYHPAEHDNHSTPDTWWHFYAVEDYKQVGYVVQHADHFSYVKNLRDTTVGGFLFPTIRESYRVDSLRNILYLRAKYAYVDFRTFPP